MRILERASGELNLAHYRVLSAVASGEERASRVAQRLALGKPTVSAAVEALSHRGLLDRRTASGDQRAIVLQLTREGEELLERAEADMVGVLERLLAGTQDEDQVFATLARLGTAMDRQATEHRQRETP
jgi:DNA-binding MarR family transcriptional regulator